MRNHRPLTFVLGVLCACNAGFSATKSRAHTETESHQANSLRRLLDAPLLFVKRHSYKGIHIYDTYYKWEPGGGIYVIENPGDPPDQHNVRAVIDPTTPETLGEGMYTDPELSWDAKRLLFCFKGKADGNTRIYEIGIDGTGLRRLTNPIGCGDTAGRFTSHHDVGPAYLPDGRIVFTSTRPNSLVPCNNTGVDILHVMNGDGTGIHTISVNNVNEFDPCVLPDGRILHGRWEYVDKTALTQQSLWTIFPDGTNETAFFANNLVHPEALLDARPVPGSNYLVAASFTPHNSPPRGTIGVIDTYLGKNSPAAITNFEHKDAPTYDHGDSCEPWPLSRDVILFSGRPKGAKYNVIEIMNSSGSREVVASDPNICCHSPMLVKPRPKPPILCSSTRSNETTGRFYVQDIYKGLTGVNPGEVKWLRVIEETSRVSGTPGGAYNQTFLISAALAFSAKNFLGIVPVEADGSVYFEVPSGRPLYLQALDADKRLIQSMRTFVQAAPGVTRSCIGCHEHKNTAPTNRSNRRALRREPVHPEPESWGSGFVDYPGMVQPILNKHCVRCHGGEEGFRGKLDLSGGWTEHFNISYENLVSRRETQLTAYLISGIDCMNGTALWSARIFPPRSHGSGAAPLAKILVSGHENRIETLTRRERDLLLAWIDTNGVYHGTWDYTEYGCQLASWPSIKQELIVQMRKAGCTRCHGNKKKVSFENDWFNLERPIFSRILRAPLARSENGLGLALCRDRKVDPDTQRIRMMVTGGYVHHVLPLDKFKPRKVAPSVAKGGEPVITFESTEDAGYEEMLAIIQDGRRKALTTPRVDMPGAEIIPGIARQLIPPPLPVPLPTLKARVDAESIVHLSWERSARTIGLLAEVHRGARADFTPGPETRIAESKISQHVDIHAPQGEQHYAVILYSGTEPSSPIRTTVFVPAAPAPPPPTGTKAIERPGEIALSWLPSEERILRYNLYRAAAESNTWKKLNETPLRSEAFVDTSPDSKVSYRYVVRSVSRRGLESEASSAVTATPLPERKKPVFEAPFKQSVKATLLDDEPIKGDMHGNANVSEGSLDLRAGGYASYDHKDVFDLSDRLSVSFRVQFGKPGNMPVVLCCGRWKEQGWFLQKLGNVWRWHVGGVDCDGGNPAVGQWIHVAATFDGERARLFQNGVEVASQPCNPTRSPHPGPLIVGQYDAPGDPYQVFGRVADVKIYQRALSPQEIAAMFKADMRP